MADYHFGNCHFSRRWRLLLHQCLSKRDHGLTVTNGDTHQITSGENQRFPDNLAHGFTHGFTDRFTNHFADNITNHLTTINYKRLLISRK